MTVKKTYRGISWRTLKAGLHRTNIHRTGILVHDPFDSTALSQHIPQINIQQTLEIVKSYIEKNTTGNA